MLENTSNATNDDGDDTQDDNNASSATNRPKVASTGVVVKPTV